VGPKVIVVSRDELADVVATNPFPEETDPRMTRMDGIPAGWRVVPGADQEIETALDEVEPGWRDESLLLPPEP
jgi:hypothetical protein